MKKVMFLLGLCTIFSCTTSRLDRLEKKVDKISNLEFKINIPQAVDETSKIELENKISALRKYLNELESKVNIQKIVVSNYKTGASKLTKEQKEEISNKLMNISKNSTIEIIGYADLKGDYRSNLNIGFERATEVKNYIESLGYKVNNLTSKGSNEIKSKLNSSINRRVEIFIK